MNKEIALNIFMYGLAALAFFYTGRICERIFPEWKHVPPHRGLFWDETETRGAPCHDWEYAEDGFARELWHLEICRRCKNPCSRRKTALDLDEALHPHRDRSRIATREFFVKRKPSPPPDSR